MPTQFKTENLLEHLPRASSTFVDLAPEFAVTIDGPSNRVGGLGAQDAHEVAQGAPLREAQDDGREAPIAKLPGLETSVSALRDCDRLDSHVCLNTHWPYFIFPEGRESGLRSGGIMNVSQP